MPTRSTTTMTEAADTAVPVKKQVAYRDRILLLNLGNIAPPRVPLREMIDPEAVQEIARSMQQDGLYQLPGVRRIGRNRYELVWGQTRVCAARAAGWTHIEVVLVNDIDDLGALRLGLNENLQRRELTPADKLRIIAELQALGLNGKEIAATTPISASDVSRLPRIAARPLLWDAIRAGTLTVRAAQELLTLSDAALAPLLATIAARRADGDAMAIVAELRPLAEAARAADDAVMATPRATPRPAVAPLAHIERGIKRLIRADDDVWDDDTLARAEALSARQGGGGTRPPRTAAPLPRARVPTKLARRVRRSRAAPWGGDCVAALACGSRLGCAHIPPTDTIRTAPSGPRPRRPRLPPRLTHHRTTQQNRGTTGKRSANFRGRPASIIERRQDPTA